MNFYAYVVYVGGQSIKKLSRYSEWRKLFAELFCGSVDCKFGFWLIYDECGDCLFYEWRGLFFWASPSSYETSNNFLEQPNFLRWVGLNFILERMNKHCFSAILLAARTPSPGL